MKSIAGVFTSRQDAVRSVQHLQALGIENDHINLLTPDNPDAQMNAVPTTEGEQPGMGPAIGAVVGGASGTALGLGLTSLLIPGVGPVALLGLAVTGLFGAGGVLAGAAAGDKLESSLDDGLPKDEIFVYEDAVRKGRSVVIALVDDDMADTVRDALQADGSESVDAARHQWWLGVRSSEEAYYDTSGGKFAEDEPVYRRGFENALHYDRRGKSFDEVQEELRQCERDYCDLEPFRRGYERGRSFYEQSRSHGGSDVNEDGTSR